MSGYASNQPFMQDESMEYATDRNKKYIQTYKHEFEDKHCRVHFCHNGPHICPICPAINAGETMGGDLEWLLHRIKKKYNLEVYRRTKKNGTWTWNIRQLPAV